MFCTECGQKLNDDAKFCSNCGVPQKKADNGGTGQTEAPAANKAEKAAEPASFVIPNMVEDSIESVMAAISSNGKYLAMKEQGKSELEIMDTTTGKIFQSIAWNKDWGSMEENSIAAVSNDGNYVTILSFDHTHVVNVQNGEQIYLSRRMNSGGNSSFSWDNKRLAYYDGDKALSVINIPKGNTLLSISVSFLDYLTLSPNGHYLGIHHYYDGETAIYDARTGSKLYILDPYCATGENRCFTSISFSHDGKQIITATPEGTIKTWDATTGNMLLQFGDKITISSSGIWGPKTFVRFSPCDRVAVVGYDQPHENGCIQIFNVETGEMLKQLGSQERGIEWVSYSADGKKLISYSGSCNGTLKFWAVG